MVLTVSVAWHTAAAPPAVARDLSQAADAAKMRDLRRRPSQTARRFQQGGQQQGGAGLNADAARLAAEAAADAASQAGPAGWLPAAVNLPAAVRWAAIDPAHRRRQPCIYELAATPTTRVLSWITL